MISLLRQINSFYGCSGRWRSTIVEYANLQNLTLSPFLCWFSFIEALSISHFAPSFYFVCKFDYAIKNTVTFHDYLKRAAAAAPTKKPQIRISHEAVQLKAKRLDSMSVAPCYRQLNALCRRLFTEHEKKAVVVVIALKSRLRMKSN